MHSDFHKGKTFVPYNSSLWLKVRYSERGLENMPLGGPSGCQRVSRKWVLLSFPELSEVGMKKSNENCLVVGVYDWQFLALSFSIGKELLDAIL
jgi:hypothetical protein